jgi:hypothetical protein
MKHILATLMEGPPVCGVACRSRIASARYLLFAEVWKHSMMPRHGGNPSKI